MNKNYWWLPVDEVIMGQVMKLSMPKVTVTYWIKMVIWFVFFVPTKPI